MLRKNREKTYVITDLNVLSMDLLQLKRLKLIETPLSKTIKTKITTPIATSFDIPVNTPLATPNMTPLATSNMTIVANIFMKSNSTPFEITKEKLLRSQIINHKGNPLR